ncbi:MAG: adenylate kinase [bacterium]
MRLILLGAPGGGKGTQAKKIMAKYNIPQISTGDILRRAVADKTGAGLKAKAYMDRGELVPDSIVVEMLEGRLIESDCTRGFILDGFPRTVEQAQTLDSVLENIGAGIDKVININVDENELVKRLCGRRVCKECGENFNVHLDSEIDTCTKCGGMVYQRSDDNEETISNRLKVYRNQTQPLIDFYKERGKLIQVDGKGVIEEVFEAIVKAL